MANEKLELNNILWKNHHGIEKSQSGSFKSHETNKQFLLGKEPEYYIILEWFSKKSQAYYKPFWFLRQTK